jgi:hypothetical protein
MKILVISQHLLPMQTPRAHRTSELVKELGKRGHDVTLYAVLGKYDYTSFEKKYGVKVKNLPLRWMVHPYNSDNDKRRTLVDKVLGKLLRKFEFPNIEFKHRVPKILKNDHNYDALITIADPHQIHWGVASLRKKSPHLVPPIWIADCGDPFMLNGSAHHLSYFEKFERRFSEQCDFLTVPVEEAKQGYYSEYREKIRVIPQGFEFEEDEKRIEPNNAVLTFAYAGVFYKDIRNPETFLNYLCSVDKDFRFEVYTPDPSSIQPFRSKLGERLVLKSPLERKHLIAELKKKDFLINIENVNSPAQIPSKLIDYGIIGRPILSVNPVDLNQSVINEFLNRDYSNQYIVNNLEQYNIRNVADKFLELINEKRAER